MIRKFNQNDMAPVIKIWLEASIEAHDFIESGFWESKANEMKELYIPSAETFVFEEMGIIKGFVSLLGGTLAALFVSPRYQGKGIGTQLLSYSKTKQRKLVLTVYQKNQKSINFYQRNGFEIKEEQIDHHTHQCELVMEYSSQ